MEINQNINQDVINKTKNDVPYKHKRIVRVIVQMRDGRTSTGTGFFISKDGDILTCAHVISGMELKKLKVTDFNSNNNEALDVNQSQQTKFQNYLIQSIISIQVETIGGDRLIAEIVKINEDFDVALIKITKMEFDRIDFEKNNFPKNETPFFQLDDKYIPEYDESVFFCGFQLTGGYTNPTQYPFSINRAVISALPMIEVAGGEYEHIQLNSINLDGNSGAPLFIEGGNSVIGMINGNMNWNEDIPLCITYATSLKLIKDKSNIL